MLSVSALELNGLAGLFALIRSNLCTRPVTYRFGFVCRARVSGLAGPNLPCSGSIPTRPGTSDKILTLYIQVDTIMLHKGSFVKLRLSDIQSVNRRKITFPTRLSVTLIQRRHVIMKNLFDAAMANQVKTRLGKLEPQSERRWGKMTAAQILAHCSRRMQWAGGERVPEKGA